MTVNMIGVNGQKRAELRWLSPLNQRFGTIGRGFIQAEKLKHMRSLFGNFRSH